MSRHFNNSQKVFIWHRQNGCCGNCGQNLSNETDIEYHHVLNYKDGGASIVENAVMLCELCHLHCHDYDYKKSVFVFRQQFTYANWPANRDYKGRKKGKQVTATRKMLTALDHQYQGDRMQVDNYENHIRMLVDFEKNLLALKRHLQVIREQYQKQINAMESAGFVENIISPLRTKYQIFSRKIDELDQQLQQHQQKIAKQNEALKTLSAIARMN